jgi:hypothetical protein
VQVSYQLTPEDYRRGCIAWRKLYRWRRWLYPFAYFMMALTVPTAIMLAIFDHSVQTLKVSGAILLFAALWFSFMLLAPRYSARRQFRGSPSAQSPMTLGMSDAGLEIHSVHSDSKASWSAFVDWAETKSLFVILPQPRIYIPIPKRAFSEEQIVEFREILRRNIVRKK